MRKFYILVGIAITLLLIRLSYFTVDASEYAYVTVFGRMVAVHDGGGEDAGLHSGWPWPILTIQRLDRRLQGRIDPSDVLQEAYLEVARSLADYLRHPVLPFFLWLRLLTGRSCRPCTGITWAPRSATPAGKYRCTTGRCRKPARCRWRPSCWAAWPAPRTPSPTRRRRPPWRWPRPPWATTMTSSAS